MSHGGCGETAVCSAIHAPSSLEARIREGSQWPGGGPRLRSPPVGLEAEPACGAAVLAVMSHGTLTLHQARVERVVKKDSACSETTVGSVR